VRLCDHRGGIPQADPRGVCDHGTQDYYTGDPLDWSLVSTYSNEESPAGRTAYKLGFAALPTVDHIPGEAGRYGFVICSWRTNDAKSDLTREEFVELCRKVIARADRVSSSP
jgi:hypothetical protein